MKTTLKIGCAAFALAASAAMAQGPGMQGPGMMNGPGMMGYGPGMMNGPGMMGYGPGMMGMGGFGPMAALNLTEDQQDKIFAIHEQMRAKNFATMSKMRQEMFKLRKLMNAETPDTKAVVEQQKKVDDVRREMLASHLDTRKEIDKVLTPEQRKQHRQMGPWWSPEDGG